MAGDRRQQILVVLAGELEREPGNRITTASLARAVGVSEAALYRHFPSKTKMFEELISFAEQTVFSRVNQVVGESQEVPWKCRQICTLVLTFASKNPGIARLLMGDVLMGENVRLRKRTVQFFARLEVELKQLLRLESPERQAAADPAAFANLLVAILSGRIAHYVRTEFEIDPLTYWNQQWQMLMSNYDSS